MRIKRLRKDRRNAQFGADSIPSPFISIHRGRPRGESQFKRSLAVTDPKNSVGVFLLPKGAKRRVKRREA
jgi:hypothetical protein